MMAEEDASNGYKTAYDLTYNAVDYGYNEKPNPVYGTGWSNEWGFMWPGAAGETGSWNQPPYGPGELHTGGHRHRYKPPSTIIKHHKIIQQKENKINWQKIGIIILIKLGLAKLMTFGFINIVTILVIKLKLFLKAIISKFILQVKLMQSFKNLMLPVLLLPQLPTLMQLLSMLGRLLNAMNRPENNNNMPSSPGSNTQPNQPGMPGMLDGLLPNRPGNTQQGRPGGSTPGRPGGLLPGVTRPPGTGTNSGTNGNRLSDETGLSSFKNVDFNLLNRQLNYSFATFDPTSTIVQKILDSEKCVERIACRIAAAEKAGVMPFWINW